MAAVSFSLLPTLTSLSSPSSPLFHPRFPSRLTRRVPTHRILAVGGDFLGDFGARDPFPAEIESNFGDKVLGSGDTEHRILIPNISALSLSQGTCQPVSPSQPPMAIEDARKLLRKVVGWRLVEGDGGLRLQCTWKVRDHACGVELISRIQKVTEAVGHCPDLHMEQPNQVKAELWTASVASHTIAAPIHGKDSSDPTITSCLATDVGEGSNSPNVEDILRSVFDMATKIPSSAQDAHAGNDDRANDTGSKLPLQDAPVPQDHDFLAKDNAALFSFCPRKPDGEFIGRDSDFSDPNVIHGLVECMILPAYQKLLQSQPEDELMSQGLKNTFMGLSQFLTAHKSKKSSTISEEQAWELRQISAENDRLREYVTVLENKALDTSKSEELETKLAKMRADSDKSLYEARQEIRNLERKVANRDETIRELEDSQALLKDNLQASRDKEHLSIGLLDATMYLLANGRKLYLDLDREADILKRANTTLIDHVRSNETLVAQSTMLKQEVSHLRSRLERYELAMSKIVAESGRVDPPAPGTGPSDPRNLLLQKWHPEELRLRRELADAETRVPQLVHDRVKELECLFESRLAAARRDEFKEGHLHGFRRGREQAVADALPLSSVNADVDKYLRDLIQVLYEPDGELWESFLRVAEKALQASEELGSNVAMFAIRP